MGYAEEPLPNPQQFLKKKPNDTKTIVPSARKFVFYFVCMLKFFFFYIRKRNIIK
jgi:hypothetical protein